MRPDEDTAPAARRRLDFASGAVLAVLCLVAIFWLIPSYVPGKAENGGLAPSSFPTLTAAIVLVLSLALMLRSRDGIGVAGDGTGGRLLRDLGAWSVFAVSLFAILTRAGFVAAGIFAILAGLWLSRHRRQPWLALLIAVALPLVVAQGVWWIFGIRLP